MKQQSTQAHRPGSRISRLALALGALLLAGAFWLGLVSPARAEADRPQGSPFHPTFPLLDRDGRSVVESGQPLSTMQSCGSCHDTAFIEQHSFHADIGLQAFGAPGQSGDHSWDTSPGFFGNWNPLTYRYLSPAEDTLIDLTTVEWLQLLGGRHVGGGPAVTARDGRSLLELPATTTSPETAVVDPETGELVAWDWQESGVVEMNCFLCHLANPDNEARLATLAGGEFGWANSATLLKTGLIETAGSQWQWNSDAFDDQGQPLQPVAIQDPANENCGLCHGQVHDDTQTPLTLDNCSAGDWTTTTSGQLFSPQRISTSGLNLADKNALDQSWDVHAERVVACIDCHHAQNNPIYFQEPDDTRPEHLRFDPRRIDFGEYLEKPLHQFATGQNTLGLDDNLRRCADCHEALATHDLLPYQERHMAALSCESCHVPELYAPAWESVNWTILQLDGRPQSSCRGSGDDADGLLHSYEPALLPRDNGDGSTSLAPFNLISTWYWVYGQPERPVPQSYLEAAWLVDGNYHPDVVAVFDTDKNGRLDSAELQLDTPEKVDFIAGRLDDAGLDNPRIAGEILPYSISHNVTSAERAVRRCSSCHGEESRLAQPFDLAGSVPGGVLPIMYNQGATILAGDLELDVEGRLFYQPQTADAGLYILGYDAVEAIDWIGIVLFLGTLVGAAAHGGLRYVSLRRQVNQAHGVQAGPALEEVYMYGLYERLWHWLQTVAILALIFTGLIIHKPDKFGIFSFSYVVQVHNILAAILLINAFLAAFYHLASGEIRQFLPQPRGFFNQAIEQSLFYLRGIFKGEAHPFEKTRQRKLNPLQQITYFAILNVLLPLQIITGSLMWGVQHWPETAARLGGLPFLAPFHTLVAWSFASFVVMHVYLTTTGHTPMANIRAMMVGWDEVEVHRPEEALGVQGD